MTDYAKAIDSVFAQFGIEAKVIGKTVGPSVTRYEAALGRGVKVSKVSGLEQEIAYATAAQSVRILAPIPGKSAVGVELPNEARHMVTQDEVPAGGHPLCVGIGKDVEGNMVTANLNEMPHLLVAGATGSGKSAWMNSMLVSLLRSDPDRVKLVLIDPKMVELTPYDGVAHLLRPVVTEMDDAVIALKELEIEMDARYEMMRNAGQRNIDGLGLPHIVVVVDELADLVMTTKGVEKPLTRIAQKARAAGIHLVLATQRPTVDVVTGVLKANVPSRLAFATSSATDSRVILDEAGAEQLLGKGDGLFKPVGARDVIRIQAPYVTDKEIATAVRNATAAAAVEDMVERIHPHIETPQPQPQPGIDPITVSHWLNQLIDRADSGLLRAHSYHEQFNKRTSFFSRGGKTDLLVEAPNEIRELGVTFGEIAGALRLLRDERLMA